MSKREKLFLNLGLLPSLLSALVFVYALVTWTAALSFTNSRFMPRFKFVGFKQYIKLFSMERWNISLENLLIFALLFICFSLLIGFFLAVFLDQKIRYEGVLKTVYMYPLAMSFIVTGTVWKWLMTPSIGVGKFFKDIGLDFITFDWISNPKMSLYAIVLAAAWQSSGLTMALILSALRGIDSNIIKAAKMDGAKTWQIYFKIIIPLLAPAFFSASLLLLQTSIKTFDVVVSLTGGGPGHSSDLPSTFMYDYSFTRNRLALGASSSMILLMSCLAIMVPWFYARKNDAH